MVVLIVDGGTDDVRGEEVRGELDARERAVHGLRDGLHEQGLGQSGDALEQQVAVRDEREQHAVDELFLTGDDASDLGAEGADECRSIRNPALQFLKFFLSHTRKSPRKSRW